MMKFWFKGHHYRTQIRHTLSLFTRWYSIKGLVRAWWHHEKYLSWLDHLDDCCDYWTPIHLPDGSINPKVKRAFMLDDELGLTAQSITKGKEK